MLVNWLLVVGEEGLEFLHKLNFGCCHFILHDWTLPVTVTLYLAGCMLKSDQNTENSKQLNQVVMNIVKWANHKH